MAITVDSLEEMQEAFAQSREDIRRANRDKMVSLLWDMISVRLDFLGQLAGCSRIASRTMVPVLLDGWDEMDRLMDRRMREWM